MKTPQSTCCPSVRLAAALTATLVLSVPAMAQTTGPAGILESAVTTLVRPIASAPTLIALPSRGTFTFPAPYGTQGVRLTNAADCGGADCVASVGYSYWRNMNNHAGRSQILIALTLARTRGGGGPTLFSYDKITGQTRSLGPLFDASNPLSWATGEGWYFSATMPDALYLNDGSRMLRYDVSTRAMTPVVDVADYLGPDRSVWQMHSSNDDSVHSFTVRDRTGSETFGCGVYLERSRQFTLFPARGEFDECQIDKSGRFLVIKENADGVDGFDNVVEDLATGRESFLPDRAGALGHSDLGFGYGVGEDDWNSLPGAIRLWQYGPDGITNGRVVFRATDWRFGANHIAHSNARADAPLNQQMACSSSANRLPLPHANEIVCYRLDGTMAALVVAPVMTDLDAPGGGPDDYSKEPKGNLDVTGEYFLWTTNMGTARQDAFLVRVPRERLQTGAAETPGDSTPAAPLPLMAAPVMWTNLVNVGASGATLTKARGCDGCADAGATSIQQITAGDGFVEVVAADVQANRVIGLSRGNAGTSAEEILFGLRLNGGVAEVREQGAYRADVAIVANDRLRVVVAGGVVQYQKNGQTFYTSGSIPVYPLLVDASLNDLGATLTSVTMGMPGNGVAAQSPTAQSSTPAADAFWTSAVNATITAAGVQKTGGCDGCADAGALSAPVSAATGVRLDVAAGAGGLRFVGLGPDPTLGLGTDLSFAYRLAGGVAEVRERGAYVAEIPAAPADILSIVVENGRVRYLKNGLSFFSSSQTAAPSLRASAALYGAGATVPTPVWRQP